MTAASTLTGCATSRGCRDNPPVLRGAVRHPAADDCPFPLARIELRKLDQLCEGLHDALQGYRDHLVDWRDAENIRVMDLLLICVNDVMEHANRVLTHARRLEATIVSAAQIHCSAMAHRTSEIARTLTVITALFMPRTLIAGILGINCVDMPLLKDKGGFWLPMMAMAAVVVALLFFFRRNRYLDDLR